MYLNKVLGTDLNTLICKCDSYSHSIWWQCSRSHVDLCHYTLTRAVSLIVFARFVLQFINFCECVTSFLCIWCVSFFSQLEYFTGVSQTNHFVRWQLIVMACLWLVWPYFLFCALIYWISLSKCDDSNYQDINGTYCIVVSGRFSLTLTINI